MAEARRVDQQAGLAEVAEFFGSGPDRLFGIRSTPASGEAFAGVVMCSPVLAQFRVHYRHGVLSARALAARGVAVQRFHYRGMGNSDGDISNLTLESMREDAESAASHLRDRVGPVPVAFMGVNVGAYPAAAASRPDHALVLDSPPPNGRGYFRNAMRAHGVYKLRQETDDGLTLDGLHDELRKPSADVALLGYRLGLRLYESLSTAVLVDEVGGPPRPTLLIGLGESGVLRPEGEKLRIDLTERGFEVDVEVRDKVDPFWYVENSAPEDQRDIVEVAARVVDWLRLQTTGSMVGRSLEDA
jgi:alpha/beta superfamily hydrolase